ncbi:MAG TPA: carboxypeptidase-like regulatory domain-containing protein [Flavobacterium sp.]
MKNFILIALSLLANITIAQTTAKIVDENTGEIIPYANITIGPESQVSNAEGFFTVPPADATLKIVVTCMGYVGKETTIGLLSSQNFVVKLSPATYELDDVSVTRPDPAIIMATVKKNLSKHYASQLPVAKDMLFIRETNNFSPKKMDFEITESTGFTKKGLAQANSDLSAFTAAMKSHPPKQFTDMLCNYYLPAKSASKLEVIKATKLNDETRSTSIEEMYNKLATMLLKHLDTSKYYRFKTGWIGTRDTISLRKDFNNKKNKKKAANSQLLSSKGKLTAFLTENNFLKDSKLTFVTQPEIYEYTYDGAVFLNNDLVYVLKFKPRKSKALYTGTVYVSSTDYAVIRTDYTLGKGKTEGGINVKWLLGIKMSENISTGTTIYKQNSSGEGYYLQYATVESGQYFYLNRPFKFIELSKEEKDVLAFDVKVEGDMNEKTEFLNISRTEVGEPVLATVNEANFKYQQLKRYDPKIWAEYGAIEPLQEMKRFTVPE